MPRDAITREEHRMTPQAFIARWGPGGPAYELNEEQGAQSHFIDRVVLRAGLSEADAKELQKRTLTNLYNQRPAWLAMAHEALDATVAAAYGWADVTPQTSDDEILARLLALNLQRVSKG